MTKKLNLLLITLLLISLASCNKSNPQLERDLCKASFEGDFEKVKQFIKEGANVNTSIYQRSNPISLAILSAAPTLPDEDPSKENRLKRLEMVRFLIENGASLKKREPIKLEAGKTDPIPSPLALAKMVDDDKELEEMLIKAGANPDTSEEEKDLKDISKKNLALMWCVTYEMDKKEELKNNKTVSTSNSEANKKGILEIESAIIYKVGGVQPVANSTFYLLDKSAEEILQSAKIKPDSKEFRDLWQQMQKLGKKPELIPLIIWLKSGMSRPELFGDFVPKSLNEIKKNTIKSVNTNLQGKARFEELEQKKYYIFGITETRGGSCLWNLPIEIKSEKQSIILDQNNAVYAN